MDGWDWWVDGWMDGWGMVWDIDGKDDDEWMGLVGGWMGWMYMGETLMERITMDGRTDWRTDGRTDGWMDGIGRCKMFRNPAIMGMCMVIPSREFRLITHRPAWHHRHSAVYTMSVANDLFNDTLRLDNELPALAAICSSQSACEVQTNHFPGLGL